MKQHDYELDVLVYWIGAFDYWVLIFFGFARVECFDSCDFQCLVDGLCFGHCLKKVKLSIAQWVMNCWAFEHDLEILVGWWWSAANSEIQCLLRVLILSFILCQKGLDWFIFGLGLVVGKVQFLQGVWNFCFNVSFS